MAIARGSVQHTLPEDLQALVTSVLFPARCAARANSTEREALDTAVGERFNVSNTIAFPYARTGLHAVLVAMRLPRGSTVLMTPITIGPMLEVITSLGFRPEFVDIELGTFGPDLEDLDRKLKTRPAVFLLTYLFGYVPNISNILSACADSGVRVIEDFSHNIGSSFDGRPLGTFGEAGIYSASMLKYVDGYNGAFVITNDELLGQSLGSASEKLVHPAPRRIQRCILKTLAFNIMLNRYIFSFGTYPALACLKAVSPQYFKQILGPSITLDLDTDELPAYYFEDISSVQIRTIIRHLNELDELLNLRYEAALLAHDALLEVTDTNGMIHLIQPNHMSTKQTFWQFVIRVNDVASARDMLFRKGIETDTTQLMDLANTSGLVLPNAQALKSEHIFVPLHQHLLRRDYVKIFRALNNVN